MCLSHLCAKNGTKESEALDKKSKKEMSFTNQFFKGGRLILACCIIFLVSSCVKSGYEEAIVYDNAFKTGSTEKLTGATLTKYNGEYVIGRYNRGAFELDLTNLPKHKALQITVEPYFHDSWDGNNNFGGIDGPDRWTITADGQTLLNATFSNTPCNELYCLFQSYPATYGLVNNPPKTEAIYDLPGICHGADVFKTSVYKIVKTFRHTSGNVNIRFEDFLVQTNVPDKLCDESWSVGRLMVKVINTP